MTSKQEKSEFYMIVAHPDGSAPKKYYSKDNQGQGRRRLETMLCKKAYLWAYLADNKTNEILAYYHPSRPGKALNQEEYKGLLPYQEKAVKAYIIWSNEAKAKDPEKTKGTSIRVTGNLLAELNKYIGKAYKILIYDENKLCSVWQNGKITTL